MTSPSESSGYDGLDATVKTSAAQAEIESEYLDKDLKDRYKLLSYIGSGGGGIIYKVADRVSGEEVVLKLIKRDLPEQAKQRFEIEAKACSVISHPNVVQIIEYGVTSGGVHYIVMPYCKGESLRSLFQGKRLTDLNIIVDVFRQICAGLDASHKAGIVHRDMKPENVLVEAGDHGHLVHIIDFGIAKVTPVGGEIQALTQTGEIFGTPAYMSPEQCSGRRVDFRTDVYSVGCMLFEAFAGHAPFRAENAFLTLGQHIDSDIPRLPRTENLTFIADRLDAIISKCMAKEPDERYQSVIELSNDLSSLPAKEPLLVKAKSLFAHRAFVMAGIVLLVVAGAVGAGLLYKWNTEGVKEANTAVTDKILARLEQAIIALDKGDSKQALTISNSVIKEMERDGAIAQQIKKADNTYNSDGITYSAVYREALYIRGHAELLDPALVTKAQTDFQRCANMYSSDPKYEGALAFSHLQQNEVAQAKQNLHRIQPTLSSLRSKFQRPVGFNDGWNNPDIFQRIKAVNQEVIFQDIIRVDSRHHQWTPVGIKIKPDYKLWIDCKDDSLWSIGLKNTSLPMWSDADGRSHRKLHEENIQALLGMVGDNHSFLVGRHCWDRIAPGTGQLQLICNDGQAALGALPPAGENKQLFKDNLGSMIVRVIVTKPRSSDNLTGWTTSDVYQMIEQQKQKIVFQTIVSVDSHAPKWKVIDGFTVTPNNRIWLDTRDDETCDFMCPDNGVSANSSVVSAAGKEGALIHGYRVGALLGTIGDASKPFMVGTHALNMVPPAAGQLKLIFNDGNDKQPTMPAAGYDDFACHDNKGSFTVRVVITELETSAQ